MIKIRTLFVFLVLLPTKIMAFYPFDFDEANKSFNMENYNKARQDYETILEKRDDPQVHYNLGNTYYKLKDYKKAESAFTKALNAENPLLREWALYNLANSRFKQDRLEEALDDYKKVLEMNPENLKAQRNHDFVLKLLKNKPPEDKSSDTQDPQKNQSQETDKDEKGTNSENKEKNSENTQFNNEPDTSEQDKSEDIEQKSNRNEPEQNNAMSNPPVPKKPVDSNPQQKIEHSEVQRWLDSLEDNPESALREMIRNQTGEPKEVEKDW